MITMTKKEKEKEKKTMMRTERERHKKEGKRPTQPVSPAHQCPKPQTPNPKS
jgi:hypothetical protein